MLRRAYCLLLLPALLAALPLASANEGSATTSKGAAAAKPLTLLEGDAFDMAFEFASAIETDPHDMALSQGWVVNDLRLRGQLDRAMAYAERATGWHRGMELAELARVFAAEGREEDSLKAARLASQVAGQFEDWRNKRIRARLARASAYLGNAKDAERVARAQLKSDDHLGGNSARTLALIRVLAKDYDAAFKVLGDASDPTDVYITGSRVLAYLDMIDMEGVPREVKLRAAEAVKTSLEATDNVRYVAEVYPELAKRYRLLGQPLPARKALEAGEAAIDKLSSKFDTKPMFMLKTAREWGHLGEGERARSLLVQAENITPNSMNIDQPAIYAVLASGYSVLGDSKNERRLYERSLDLAAELINSRPRALQMVKILGAMGRNGFQIDAGTRSRVSEIFAGLGDPW